jgi:ATP-dependent Clp protease ATP-binding subunit ClpA
MFERMTDGARRVIVLADDEAKYHGHSHVGTEHLLLGILREVYGVGATALGQLGLGIENLRYLLVVISPPDKYPRDSSRQFTSRIRRALEWSLREALQLNCKHISTEHLLLGLIHEIESPVEGNGAAYKLLLQSGITTAAVREKVTALLTQQTPRQEPHPVASPGRAITIHATPSLARVMEVLIGLRTGRLYYTLADFERAIGREVCTHHVRTAQLPPQPPKTYTLYLSDSTWLVLGVLAGKHGVGRETLMKLLGDAAPSA